MGLVLVVLSKDTSRSSCSLKTNDPTASRVEPDRATKVRLPRSSADLPLAGALQVQLNGARGPLADACGLFLASAARLLSEVVSLGKNHDKA